MLLKKGTNPIIQQFATLSKKQKNVANQKSILRHSVDDVSSSANSLAVSVVSTTALTPRLPPVALGGHLGSLIPNSLF